MYIEFGLPREPTGQMAGLTTSLLNRYLREWAEKYQIAYTKKNHKFTVRVTFDEDRFYDFFAVTWNPDSKFKEYLLNYRFVEPMKRV